MATAKELFDGFDGLQATGGEYKSDTMDFQSKAIEKDGLLCIVQRGKFDGLTLDKHKEFRKTMTETATKMAPNATVTDLPDTEGLPTRLFQMNVPVMFVSNRSFIACQYEQDVDDSNWLIQSSRGNDALHEQYKDKIKSDVIAVQHFSCDRFTPYDGGVEIYGAVLFDMAGSIPVFIQKKGAKRGLRRLQKAVHYILTGEILDIES